MAKQKSVAPLVVNNIILFTQKERENLRKVKDLLGLKRCGITAGCLASGKVNAFDCECFHKCTSNYDFLKLFI